MSELCFLAVKCGEEIVLFNIAHIKTVIRTKQGKVIIIDINDMDYRANCTYDEFVDSLNKFLGVNVVSVVS